MHELWTTNWGSSIGRLLLGACLITLTSCRLLISTDETGHIMSASGHYSCDSPSCAFPISEEITETFTAVPADGYRFVQWRGICRRATTEVCNARIFPLTGRFAKFDGDIGLTAIFEPNTTRKAYYRDEDGDEYGVANESRMAFDRPEGYVANQDDCDDTDPLVRPWAKEQYDGRDNNCDGVVDEGFSDERFYLDADEDGFGNPEISLLDIEQPEGYVKNSLDCNDSEHQDNPEAEEVIDGRGQ